MLMASKGYRSAKSMEGPVQRAQRKLGMEGVGERVHALKDCWLWVSQKEAERKSMVQGKEESRRGELCAPDKPLGWSGLELK